MKILVINHEYPPVGGGGGVFCRDLCQAWVKMGHQVDVITSQARKLPSRKTKTGVNLYRTWAGSRPDLNKAGILNLVFFLLSGFLKSVQLFSKNHYDLVNTHFAVPSGPLGSLLQLIFRCPNLLTLHGADIYDPSRKMSGHRWWITRKTAALAINKATYAIASTPEIKNRAEKYFKISKKIKIIPLGFAAPPLPAGSSKTFSQHGPLKLINVSRLVERKNLKLLIEAVYQLKDRVLLKIVGDGPQKKILQKKIKQLKLQKEIKLLGEVSEEKKYRELLKADLYVSTAIHEGFGLAFLEAMHAGLPIVASDCGGQTYFLKDGINVRFFQSGNLLDLVEKIDFFGKNRQNLFKFGKANQKRVKAFSITKIAQEYLKDLS